MDKLIGDEARQIERDKKDYALYYREFKAKLKRERREHLMEPERRRRRWHSFDTEVLREPYDDMGPMSDFESVISHESIPHP